MTFLQWARSWASIKFSIQFFFITPHLEMGFTYNLESPMFFPRACEGRVLLIVGFCYTFSHLHIFTLSHLHIFLSSHLIIFTSSRPFCHLHILSSSRLNIFTSSLLRIFTSSHLHIFTHLLSLSLFFTSS